MSRDQQATVTRDAVITAAAEAFDRYGYSSASMSRIVEFADRTKGAVYFHFPSKRDLAAAVLEHQFTVCDRILADVQDRELDFIGRLTSLTAQVVSALRTDVVLRAAIRLTIDRDAEPVRGEAATGRWVGMLEARFADAQERGEIPGSVRIGPLARLMVSTFVGMGYLTATERGLAEVEDQMDDYWALFLPVLRGELPVQNSFRLTESAVLA